jgi:hypothetical protein
VTQWTEMLMNLVEKIEETRMSNHCFTSAVVFSGGVSFFTGFFSSLSQCYRQWSSHPSMGQIISPP